MDDSATKDNGHQGMGQTKSEGVQVSYKGGHDNGDTKSSHPSVSSSLSHISFVNDIVILDGPTQGSIFINMMISISSRSKSD